MSKQTKKQKSKKETARKSADPKGAALDTKALDETPVISTSDPVIGTLSPTAEKDTPAPGQDPKRARRKTDSAEEQGTIQVQDQTPGTAPDVLSAEAPGEPEPEPLRLPRGGFVAFRKSGGLNFSTREVVVYPDGRVAYDVRGVPQKEYNNLRRVLNDGQIISLRKLLDQTNFWKAESGGTQNPDAFAYEIAARIGQRSNEVEVFDGSAPEHLEPLIERLTKLLPE